MKKILIIEDNKEIRENTEELLQLNNYAVTIADNGNAGFKIAKNYKPDLILCDMLMPETDGPGFLKLARQDADVRDIPIIFFSAGSLCIEVRSGAIEAVNGYLQKPFTEEELLKAIETGVSVQKQ